MNYWLLIGFSLLCAFSGAYIGFKGAPLAGIAMCLIGLVAAYASRSAIERAEVSDGRDS